MSKHHKHPSKAKAAKPPKAPVEKPEAAKSSKRSHALKVYANINQKIKVAADAKAAGMTVSDYLLSLALRYEPKHLLDARQERLLETLIGARRDIILLGNALRASAEVRKAIFHNASAMQEWYRNANILIAKIEDFFRRLKRPNDFDLSTANSDNRQLKTDNLRT